MWKNSSPKEKDKAAVFLLDQCQVIIKNKKHTSFFRRDKWTLYNLKGSMETSYAFDWKYLEEKFNLHNFNNIYVYTF